MRAHAHAGSGPKEGTQVIHVPAPHPTKILPPQRPVAGSCCKRKQPAGSESLTARTASCSHGWHFTLLWVFAAPRGSISQGRVPGTLGGGVMTETPKSLQSDHRSDLSPARAGGVQSLVCIAWGQGLKVSGFLIDTHLALRSLPPLWPSQTLCLRLLSLFGKQGAHVSGWHLPLGALQCSNSVPR